MATGEIVPCETIGGTLHVVGELTGSVSLPASHDRITGAITVPASYDYIHEEEYEGEYVVTPRPWNETILETENKILRNNVTVEVIPYYETSNLSGGSTVYIGGN